MTMGMMITYYSDTPLKPDEKGTAVLKDMTEAETGKVMRIAWFEGWNPEAKRIVAPFDSERPSLPIHRATWQLPDDHPAFPGRQLGFDELPPVEADMNCALQAVNVVLQSPGRTGGNHWSFNLVNSSGEGRIFSALASAGKPADPTDVGNIEVELQFKVDSENPALATSTLMALILGQNPGEIAKDLFGPSDLN